MTLTPTQIRIVSQLASRHEQFPEASSFVVQNKRDQRVLCDHLSRMGLVAYHRVGRVARFWLTDRGRSAGGAA